MTTTSQKAAQAATLAAVREGFNTHALPALNGAGMALFTNINANSSPILLQAYAAVQAMNTAIIAAAKVVRTAIADTAAIIPSDQAHAMLAQPRISDANIVGVVRTKH